MSTQKPTVNSSTNYSTQPATQATLTTALIDQGSIPIIQNALLHELQASGWTQNLREHVTALMRSGECTRHEDLMDRVLEQALANLGGDQEDKESTNDQVAELAIPPVAITQAIKIVKKELEKICLVENSA